jgi:hypothetical protein
VKGQAPGAFDRSVPAVTPVTVNPAGNGDVIAGGVIAGGVIAGSVIAGSVIAGGVIAGGVIAGSVIAGSVIAGGVITGGGGILTVIQPGMRASISDKERRKDLFNLLTS